MSLAGCLLFPVPNWSGLIHAGVGVRLVPWNPRWIPSGPRGCLGHPIPKPQLLLVHLHPRMKFWFTLGWLRIQESEQKLAASGGPGPEPPQHTSITFHGAGSHRPVRNQWL